MPPVAHLGLPATTPVLHARNELRLGEPRARAAKQVYPAPILPIQVVPRLPALDDLALADASDRHLLRMLDALLALGRELRLHLALQILSHIGCDKAGSLGFVKLRVSFGKLLLDGDDLLLQLANHLP